MGGSAWEKCATGLLPVFGSSDAYRAFEMLVISLCS